MVRTKFGLMFGAFVSIAIGAAGSPASAAEPDNAGSAAEAPAAAAPPPAPAPPAPAGAPETDPSAASAGVPLVAASAQAASAVHYGVGLRGRVTSVPKWLLGLFLDESVPLTSYTAGAEFFRRSGNFDFVIGLAYQNLSPKDGNWLGSGNDPGLDTDLIQFRNLGAFSFDVAFILHSEFNEYVGMHYGGGVGVGVITGKMLRTSNGSLPGCRDDPGNTAVCYPVCDGARCTEQELQNRSGATDSPESPSRFADSHVPTVYPIVNLVTGLDVRLPTVPGLAFKVDLGYFFPYFFLGGSLAYQL